MKNQLFNRLVLVTALLCATAGSAALDLKQVKWELSRFARIEGSFLTVDVPAGSERTGGSAVAELDLSAFSGKCFGAEIRAAGERITVPTERWNGLKFMFNYTDPKTGEQHWPNTRSRTGDFPSQLISVCDNTPDRPLSKVRLILGLQSSSGKVVFDLSTLRVFALTDLYPRVNGDYRVSYPARVAQLPVLRGVMLPGGKCKEDDFRTLHAWGATLARYQMIRDWGAQNANQDLADFDRWLTGKLDHLEHDVLPWARKYGLRIVVDLHVPPGGRSGGEMNMFHDATWADHFITCWKWIATRFKGHSEIYGYDLINEPEQQERSPEGLGYWDVQRRAAEAVRAIDPATPIIIESNGWDSAPAYTYLSPLAMDNVIYQVHMYQPFAFTHQGVHAANDDYPRAKYPDPAKGWNRDYIKACLAPVLAFQQKHNARIYVGEFSAIAWAEGADRYIADCISVFEEYGWDWTYHAFREWAGWSVEHSADTGRHLAPSADNPRRRALLAGLARPARASSCPAAPAVQAANTTTQLLFSASFDGLPGAEKASGSALPREAKGLAFTDGHRGQALRLTTGASAPTLAYAAQGNLVPARGTFTCWVRAPWDDRPHDEWRAIALTWENDESHLYFDGRPETTADTVGGKRLALTSLIAFPPNTEVFFLGGRPEEREIALDLDDVRLYSAPLAPEQIRKLARRELVAELTLTKANVFADRTTTLEVKTANPAHLDLSALKYCLHTKDGKPIVTFRQKVEAGTTKLRVNLPAGRYVLRTTDGDWFYGCAPFTVRPETEAPPPPPQIAKPLSGIKRFWRDVDTFDKDTLRHR